MLRSYAVGDDYGSSLYGSNKKKKHICKE
ncbi:unnamed protein product, partial [Didymodactylos carnosus]